MAGQSTLRLSKGEIARHEAAKAKVLGVQPAIDFYNEAFAKNGEDERSQNQKERQSDHKDNYVTFDVPLSLAQSEKDDNAPTYETKIKKFAHGTPEEWCYLRSNIEGLSLKLGHPAAARKELGDEATFSEVEDKVAELLIPYYSSVLQRASSKVFENALNTYANKHKRIQLRLALNAVAKIIFPHADNAYRNQKRYLTKAGLRMGSNKPTVFADRLAMVNQYLQYFPRKEQANGQMSMS